MQGSNNFVTLTPLGGLGEIGLNCMLLSTPNGMVMIDCGLLFPSDYHLGVDIIIPKFDYVLKNIAKLKGIIITHGHEDHIGALPWLLQQIKAPIYSSEFTLALIAHKLEEHNLKGKIPLIPVFPNDSIDLAGCSFRFFPVCHSIIDGYALGISTPVGKFIHTGDFKLDPDPFEGQSTDLNDFTDFLDGEPAKLLLSDSTNVERDGHSLTEREVYKSLQNFFKNSKSRIIVTLFSSHIQRIQEVFYCAAQTNRAVVVIGRSLVNNIELAQNLGKLIPPPKLYLNPSTLRNFADEKVVLIVTGSQGEPLSALSRIASGNHKLLSIKSGDCVIMSSRLIPGNAMAVNKLINNLYRLGAEVYYEAVRAIHASGHAHKEELISLFEATKPEYFIPIHGEFRHLVKHRQLAIQCGVSPEKSLIIENGQPITFTENNVILEKKIDVESIMVDGKGVGDVERSVLKERHLLGGEGMVTAILIIDMETWKILAKPQLLSKGFVNILEYNYILEDATCVMMDIYEESEPGNIAALKENIRLGLRKFFRSILKRDPVVIPVINAI